MTRNREKKKDKKYVSQIVVKKGKHEQENQEGVFNFDDEVILGVNTPHKTKDNTPTPVSYTHLDVYKRQ